MRSLLCRRWGCCVHSAVVLSRSPPSGRPSRRHLVEHEAIGAQSRWPIGVHRKCRIGSFHETDAAARAVSVPHAEAGLGELPLFEPAGGDRRLEVLTERSGCQVTTGPGQILGSWCSSDFSVSLARCSAAFNPSCSRRSIRLARCARPSAQARRRFEIWVSYQRLKVRKAFFIVVATNAAILATRLPRPGRQ